LIEWWTFWLLVAGLAWVPFWYGSNELIAWGINAVLFAGLVAIYEMSLLIRGKRHPIGIRNIGVPTGMFTMVVLWIVLQTVTWMPSSLVNPIWGMAADALCGPVAGSISVNRDLTNLALMRLITAASTFWLALQLCRNGARAHLLIVSVAAIGCLYAGYGLVVLKTGQLPWLDITTNGGRVSSTFVNRNSFATYAGIGFVAITSLILQLYRDEVILQAGWRMQFASFLEATGRLGALLLGGGFLFLAALLFTGSRGGVIATGLGLSILIVLAHRRGRSQNRQQFATILLGLVLVAVTVYVFGGVVFGSLNERGISDPSRIAVYSITLQSIFDKRFLGFGYGTFVDVFPMYRDRSISVDGVWEQAHNSYLEVFQGLGVVFGTMLIGSVIWLVLRCARGAMRRQRDVEAPGIATAAACLVGADALVDFSLQMQAVALTFAAILGAGVAQSESSLKDLKD
jgi:hypothetical protein